MGQYFTTHKKLQEKVVEFILNNPSIILEPSIGQGDLITCIKEKIPNITFDMYEIDTKIKLLENIQKNKVIYGDFLKQVISKKYQTIVEILHILELQKEIFILNSRKNVLIYWIKMVS